MKPVVLIAQADEQLSDLFRRLLAQRGYDAQTAVGGVECLTKLRRLAPDVLVLDCDLLWGGGAGVLACLDDGEDELRPPAVILTGLDRLPEPGSGELPSFVVACLQKPFPITALLEAIHAALVDSRSSRTGQWWPEPYAPRPTS